MSHFPTTRYRPVSRFRNNKIGPDIGVVFVTAVYIGQSLTWQIQAELFDGFSNPSLVSFPPNSCSGTATSQSRPNSGRRPFASESELRGSVWQLVDVVSDLHLQVHYCWELGRRQVMSSFAV
jgi:hypothetical protein